jgi:hypothetical protein
MIQQKSGPTVSSSGFTAAWEEVSGADLYELRLRQATQSNGRSLAWDTLVVVKDSTQYIFKDLESGKTYYYAVRAKIGEDYTQYTDEIMVEIKEKPDCFIPEDLTKKDLHPIDAFEKSLLCKTFIYEGETPRLAADELIDYKAKHHEYDTVEITFMYVEEEDARVQVDLINKGELVARYFTTYAMTMSGENFFLLLSRIITPDGEEIDYSPTPNIKYDDEGKDLLLSSIEYRFVLKD